MKYLFIFAVLVLVSASLFSCSEKTHSTHIKQKIDTDSLYIKYKTMIGDSSNSPACVDCAAMALAISYDMDEEITKSHEKLVEYYKQNGSVPCPELLCNTKK